MKANKSNKYKGFTIRARGNSWQVDQGSVNGKRLQRSFKTKIEAKRQIEVWLEEEKDTQKHRVSLSDMNDAKRLDILRALETLSTSATLTEAADLYVKAQQQLAGKGSIHQAIEFFLEHARPESAVVTIGRTYEEYYQAKIKAGRRPRTIEEVKYKLGRLLRDREEAWIHLVTSRELDLWLDDLGLIGTTRDAYRRQLVGFFNFALKRHYVTSNPALGLEVVSSDDRIPEIHAVDEVENILDTAMEEHPAMAPYFAIGYFAGLRPESELRGLSWKDINFEEKWILVRPETAKKRRQRHVDISPNLLKWLLPFRRRSGQIYFSRTQFRNVRNKAEVPWSQDVMRHSYGSYHLKMHDDAARTSLQMGHSRVDVLFNNYRNIVTRTEAEKYWKIEPAAADDSLHLSATA